ncbi:hypothetical protein HWV62_8811 [Athelia sp. TMB]|nr:hypothetical protein HWV62_8811 [Athelia sp. TMB]
MQTRNLKQRRPVVGSPTKGKRSAATVDDAVVESVEDVPVAVGKKRSQARAITPETEGPSPTSLLQSPSKSRVRPSERSIPVATTAVQEEHRDVVPDARESGDIVFTDDEDFVSVSVKQNGVEADSEDEPEGMPELIDVSASEDSQGEESGNEETAGDREAVEHSGEDVDDEEFEVINPPVVVSNVARKQRENIPVGKKKRTKIQDTLDKMETERDMYVQARKHSVASIASTNPGDGTKRLHGEESYIHDDIQDSPFGSRGRPRTVVPVTPTKTQKKVARAVVNRDDGKVERDEGNRDDDMVLMSDTEPRGQVGPTKCEVANSDDMDEIIDYNDLPTLFADRRLVSWSQIPGPGLAVPSAWHEENPAISMSQFRGCIQFRKSGWFFNPSRMVPSEMGLSPHPGNSYIVVGGTTKVATMTTAILVTSSNIHRMKEVFGEDRRMIAGIPHITEYQRMESGLLMALHLDSAHAQISQQAITFSTTRTMGTGGSSPSKNPSRMFRQPAGASASHGSPFASAMSNIQGSGYGMRMTFVVEGMLTSSVVPVLDARHCRFSLKNLAGLDKVLPTFNAEVPEGSLAWVGYTVNKYTTTRGSHVNFNLLWVVVLGTPE